MCCAEDIDESALKPVDGQTFCPYKGMGRLLRHRQPQTRGLVGDYVSAWTEVGRVGDLRCPSNPTRSTCTSTANSGQFEPGQTVIPHGVDRGLDTDEVLGKTPAGSP